MSADGRHRASPAPTDHPTSLLVTGADVLAPDGPRRARPIRADLAVAGERIAAIAPAANPAAVGSDGTDEAATVRIDADGLLVAPGLVDLQINGGHGHDLWSDPASLWDLARLLPRHGVTAFCPTIVSGPPDRVTTAIRALDDRPDDHRGAEPIGLHLEGPMLAASRRGAHDERHLLAPDPALAGAWAASGRVALVTLAPELPGAGAVIDVLTRAGITVAAGHTDATADEAAEAERAGVRLVTHLFNAMAPLHHRRPGLVGHVLGTSGLAAGLIVDGIHLDPVVVSLAARALGPDRLVLVTDAVAAMGLPPGQHRFGRRTITADENGVRQADGTLAGSTLTLDAAIRNLVAFTGWEAADAIGAASATPARILGLDGDRGRIAAGARADLVLLDDELRVVATIVAGHLAHLDPGAADRVVDRSPAA